MNGQLHVICGPMFSGKTEALIHRLREASEHRQRVTAFKPKVDNRYSADALVSHSGVSFPATPLAALNLHEGHPAVDADIVGIDEVQFFGTGIINQILTLTRRGVQVVASGLDLSSKGEAFGPMPWLLCFADSVQKLHAKCAQCGELARWSHRRVKSDQAILVGGAESYEPRCGSCFDPAGG